MSYLTRAQESKFELNERGTLTVENAFLFWTNFKGLPTEYNKQGGRRTFCISLTKEIADRLQEEGWNVKYREPRNEDDDPFYFTECVVNMNSNYEPRIMLCSEWNGKKSMNRLHGDAVGKLDDLRFENIDVVIDSHRYEKGAKGYCNTLVATQRKSDLFGGKYAEYEMASEEDLPF